MATTRPPIPTTLADFVGCTDAFVDKYGNDRRVVVCVGGHWAQRVVSAIEPEGTLVKVAVELMVELVVRALRPESDDGGPL